MIRMSPMVFWIFIFILMLVFLSVTTFVFEREIEKVVSSLSKDIVSAGKTTVAVVDFTDLVK